MKEDRLDELRREYESIPIPGDLEFRVRASLEQAKQDLEREQRNAVKKRKNILKIWRNTGITAVAALMAIVVLANSGADMAAAMEKVPVLGAITRVITFRTYEDEQGKMSAHVDVPRVEGGSDELNRSIQDYTGTIIAQYEEDVKASGGEGLLHVDLSYQVVTDNDSLFALRFNKTVIMASGDESVKIYNVDKATGRIIALDQMFQKDSNYIDVISENIKEQMRQQMKEDSSLTYWLDDSDVPEWNFESIDKDATFYVNEDGQLVIVFDEGAVSPMFMGVREFTIPTAILSDIALPDYLK